VPEPAPSRPLIVVAGPTGSGKSELALRIAEDSGGEIVNCDSLQIYRYFEVGSAKLPRNERRGIPHHMLDLADPDEHFSAGEYGRRGRAVLGEIGARGRLPVVAGGTGFYLRALVEGLFAGPSRDEGVRARLAEREHRRPGFLHRLLRRLDPAAASRIHPRDAQKLMRAAEVCVLTHANLTSAFAAGRKGLEGYLPLKIGLNPPREALYERLNLRCQRMFEGKLIDEVRRILLLGFSPDVKPLESHGYRQALQYLRGGLSLQEALFHAQRDTRRYAKRQWTWFRQEPDMEWFNGFGDEPELQALVVARVQDHLYSASPAGEVQST
jgi:tRNA dimethylallyltransferase